MKKLITILGLFSISFSYAQLYVPVGTNFIVPANTPLFVNNLLLKPNVNFNLSGFSVIKSNVAIPIEASSFSIKSVYTFDNLLSNFTGEIGLFYQDAELNENNSSSLKIIYNDGIQAIKAVNSVCVPANNYVSNIFSSPINLKSISAFSPTVLPITLLSFNAYKQNNQVKLQWVSKTELNADYYELERSTDGVNFFFLNKIIAAGNSINEIKYIAYDNKPANNENYYRLNLYDKDGTKTYLGLKNINFNLEADSWALYPNPFKSSITLKSPNINFYVVEVYNLKGQIIQQKNCSTTKLELDTHLLPNGNYLLKVKTATDEKFFSIIKNQ